MPSRRPVRAFGPLAALRVPLALLAVTFASALSVPALPVGAMPTADYCADPEEQLFLGLINDYREQNGLGPLTLSQSLGATADDHSADMAANSYFSHTRLDGSGIDASLQEHGYTDGTYGENIAAGIESAAEAFAMWQASPSHNANMLQDNFGAIGVGRAYQAGSGYGWYWTSVFGGEVDSQGTICGGRLSQELQDETANASSTDRLNLRSGAGPDGGVLRIVPNNARLRVIGTEQNGYLPVSYDGLTGWVLAEAVFLDGTPAPIETVTETTPDSMTLTTPPTNTTSSTSGTVSSLQATPADPLVATDDLNLRTGPGYDASILTVIPAGSPLAATGSSELGFLGVSYNGLVGWADAAYLTTAAPAATAPVAAETAESAQTVPAASATDPAAAPAPDSAATAPVTIATAQDAVNLRAAPSVDGAVLSVIPAGVPVSLTGEANAGFLGVSYNGLVGWADAAYLA